MLNIFLKKNVPATRGAKERNDSSSKFTRLYLPGLNNETRYLTKNKSFFAVVQTSGFIACSIFDAYLFSTAYYTAVACTR